MAAPWLAGAVALGTVAPWLTTRLSQRPPAQLPGMLPASLRNLLLATGMLLLLHALGLPLSTIGLGSLPPARLLAASAFGSGIVVGIDLLALARALRRFHTSAALSGGELMAQVSARVPAGPERLKFLPLALSSAFWEELCFRGVALSLFPSSAWGTLLGVAISSGLFSIHHANGGRIMMVYSALYGVLFATIYLTTGSLGAAMIAHFLGNVFVVFYTGPKLRRAAGAALAGLGI